VRGSKAMVERHVSKIGEDRQSVSFWATQSNRFEATQAPSIEPDGPFGISINTHGTAHQNESPKGQPTNQIGIATPEPAFAWDHDIRIDQGDRPAVSIAPAPTFDIRHHRTAAIASALLLVVGGLGWIGGAKLDVLGVSPAALPLKGVNHSISTTDPAKSDRSDVPGSPTNPAPTTARIGRKHETLKGASARTANSVSLPTKQNRIAPVPTTVEPAKISPIRVPVPETKPTTIEGWTVREVI
jgi:hypothetical protein